MKHTPGPWVVEAIGVEPAVKAGQWYIATTNDGVDGDLTGRKSLANANLIAAAPELLAALKDLLAASTSEDVTCACSGDTCKKAVADARAAIAKAEGNG